LSEGIFDVARKGLRHPLAINSFRDCSEQLPQGFHAAHAIYTDYHGDRNHKWIGNRLLQPLSAIGGLHGAIKWRERLGGMLSYYHRKAA
jgi:hypothetical protein